VKLGRARLLLRTTNVTHIVDFRLFAVQGRNGVRNPLPIVHHDLRMAIGTRLQRRPRRADRDSFR